MLSSARLVFRFPLGSNVVDTSAIRGSACFVPNLSPFNTRCKVTHLNFSYYEAKSAKTDRFLVVATDMSA